METNLDTEMEASKCYRIQMNKIALLSLNLKISPISHLTNQLGFPSFDSISISLPTGIFHYKLAIVGSDLSTRFLFGVQPNNVMTNIFGEYSIHYLVFGKITLSIFSTR